MSDGLFYLGSDDLVAMRVTTYDAEDRLQELIEKHPDLLAGGQMSPESPRRWLLVKREQPVPDSTLSSGRFSVDHLFVDQDAIPTLVEVKRSTDTRIRREVVGQMLDYAANGVRYWPAASLQSAFEATTLAAGKDPDLAIADIRHDPTLTVEGFFAEVETNLRAGRLRLVFVADIIPDELRRIVEFLNEQMSQAEVFAVEVKQYRADGRDDQVLVPTLIGRTGGTTATGRNPTSWTHDNALQAGSDDTRELLQLIESLAREHDLALAPTPAGSALRTGNRESLGTVYFPWNTLELLVQPLRDRGWETEADHFVDTVRAVTSKPLSTRHLQVPASDALNHWGQIRDVLLGMAQLYKSGSSEAPRS